MLHISSRLVEVGATHTTSTNSLHGVYFSSKYNVRIFHLTPQRGEGSAKAPPLPAYPSWKKKMKCIAVKVTQGEAVPARQKDSRCDALGYIAYSYLLKFQKK